jgi:hypothetical protein
MISSRSNYSDGSSSSTDNSSSSSSDSESNDSEDDNEKDGDTAVQKRDQKNRKETSKAEEEATTSRGDDDKDDRVTVKAMIPKMTMRRMGIQPFRRGTGKIERRPPRLRRTPRLPMAMMTRTRTTTS